VAWLRRWTVLLVAVTFLSMVPWPTPAHAASYQFFPQTGFAIEDPHFLDYFDKRGGLTTFGYPVSREFMFHGFPIQIFQRAIMQRYPDGHVQLLNLLDNGLFPYTEVNGAIFPGVDSQLTATAPSPTSPGYAQAILNWISSIAPDRWGNIPVSFHQAFLNTVSPRVAFPQGKGNATLLTGFDLEIWGVPTSRPTVDPHNSKFVYQRFQRGIMHYDATTKTTQGILLADYFKSILMGENLPPDLLAEAQTSPFFGQYDPLKTDWVGRPSQLPGTDLTRAFEPLRPSAVIVLDPGHGGKEIGTSHIFPDGTVLTEKDLNLAVATRTAAILRQDGFKVIQTRTTDSWVDSKLIDVTGDGKVNLADDLQSRIDIANNAHATLFLSIHFNGDDNTSISGTTVYYDAARPFSDRSEYFAQLLDQQAVAALKGIGYDAVNRGVQTDSTAVGQGNHFYVLGPDAVRPTQMPGALVEGLFLTNARDAQVLRDPRSWDALAQAYARAIEIYYGG